MFFFKQKTAYEMRISDWSSDVCSSDLDCDRACAQARHRSGRTGDLAGGTGGFPADVPDGQRGGGDSGGIGRALELRDRRNDADAAKGLCRSCARPAEQRLIEKLCGPARRGFSFTEPPL